MLLELKNRILKILIVNQELVDKQYLEELEKILYNVYDYPIMFLSFLKELHNNRELEEIEALYNDESLKIRGVIRASFIVFIIRKKLNLEAYTEVIENHLLCEGS